MAGHRSRNRHAGRQAQWPAGVDDRPRVLRQQDRVREGRSRRAHHLAGTHRRHARIQECARRRCPSVLRHRPRCAAGRFTRRSAADGQGPRRSRDQPCRLDARRTRQGARFYKSLVDAGTISSWADAAAAGSTNLFERPDWIEGKIGATYQWDLDVHPICGPARRRPGTRADQAADGGGRGFRGCPP